MALKIIAESTAGRLKLVQPDDFQESGDAHDELTSKLVQLKSMLSLVSGGEGLTNFDSLNDNLRGNDLWACANLSDYCIKLCSKVVAPFPSTRANHG